MKTTLITLGTLLSITSFADDAYQLASVDKIEVLKNKEIKISYTLPCRNLDFETFAAATDDSGELDVRVGVVYRCNKGPMKKFERTVTPNWPEYKLLESGLMDGASFVPMPVKKYKF